MYTWNPYYLRFHNCQTENHNSTQLNPVRSQNIRRIVIITYVFASGLLCWFMPKISHHFCLKAQSKHLPSIFSLAKERCSQRNHRNIFKTYTKRFMQMQTTQLRSYRKYHKWNIYCCKIYTTNCFGCKSVLKAQMLCKFLHSHMHSYFSTQFARTFSKRTVWLVLKWKTIVCSVDTVWKWNDSITFYSDFACMINVKYWFYGLNDTIFG